MKGKKFLAFSLAATLLVGSSISVFAAGVKDVFNADTYAGNYSDLAASYGTDASALLNHFLTDGAKEGRVASPILDVAAYRAAYADLDAAFGDDWNAYVNHYLTTGILEKRTTGVLFNLVDYADKNADVKAAFGNDYAAIAQHYVNHGINEGRPGGEIVKATAPAAPTTPAAPTKPTAPTTPATTTTPAGHVHVKGEKIGVGVAASCTEDGYQEWRCNQKLMKNVYDKDGNWTGTEPLLVGGKEVTCDIIWKEVLKADHSAPEDDKNVYVEHATCTQAGKYVYTCTQCGKSITKNVEKLEHDFSAVAKTADATSCSLDGRSYVWYKCKNCGLLADEPVYGEARPHRVAGYVHVVSTSTCLTRGERYGYCDECGTDVHVWDPIAPHTTKTIPVYADTYLNGDGGRTHSTYEISYCTVCKQITWVSPTVTENVPCTNDGNDYCEDCTLSTKRPVTSQVRIYKVGDYFVGNVQ